MDHSFLHGRKVNDLGNDVADREGAQYFYWGLNSSAATTTATSTTKTTSSAATAAGTAETTGTAATGTGTAETTGTATTGTGTAETTGTATTGTGTAETTGTATTTTTTTISAVIEYAIDNENAVVETAWNECRKSGCVRTDRMVQSSRRNGPSMDGPR